MRIRIMFFLSFSENVMMVYRKAYCLPFLVLVALLFLGTAQQSQAASERTKQEKADLEAGIIPPRFMENYRLVPLEDQQTLEFQTEMMKLARRMLPDHDFQKFPITFVIEDDSQINAFTFPFGKGKGAVISFTKGLIEKVTSLDELAYVFGHEWTHNVILKELGPGHNSKGEEFIADTYPLKLMHTAGFDAKQALVFTRRFLDQKRSILKVLDVHGLPENRVGAVEKGLTWLDRQRGGLHNPPTTMPTELREIVAKSHHTSFLDQQMKKENFASMLPQQQYRFLSKVIQEIDPGTNARTTDLIRELRKISVDKKDVEAFQAFNGMVDQILDIPRRLAANSDDSYRSNNLRDLLYALSVRSLTDKIATLPAGRLRLISEAEKRLMAAETQTDAFTAASKLLSILNAEKSNPDFLRTIRWPTFKLPKKGEKVPWDNLTQYALLDKTGTIAEALLASGIEDPRFYSVLTDDQKARYINDATNLDYESFSRGPRSSADTSLSVDHLTISPDGVVVRVEPDLDGHQLSERRIKKRQVTLTENIPGVFTQASAGDKTAEKALTNKVEKAAEAGVDVGLVGLETLEPSTYKKFYDYNRLLLSSSDLMEKELKKTYQKGAADLTRKFNELLTKDKKQYGDMIRGFYLGRKDKRDIRALIHIGSTQDSAIVPLDSPIMAFALRDRHGLFDQKERTFIMSQSDALDGSHWTSSNGKNEHKKIDEMLVRLRKYFEYSQPETEAELLEAARKLGAGNTRFSNLLVLYEVKRFIEKKGPRSFSVEKFIPFTVERFEEPLIGNSRDLQDIFRGFVGKTRSWPKDLSKAIEMWTTFSSHDLFPKDHELKYSQLAHLIDRIEKESPSDGKIGNYEKLLFQQRIEDPDIRDSLMNHWVAAVRNKLGTDTTTADFRAEIISVIKRLKEHVNLNDRLTLYSRLADSIQSQKKVSADFGNNRIEKTRKKLASTQKLGVLAESTVTLIRNEPRRRELMVRFLTSPVEQHLTEVADMLEEIGDYFGQDEDVSKIRDAFGVELDIDKKVFESHARRVHENFLATPFLARAAILEELILPQDQKNEEDYRKSVEYVMTRLFPPTLPHATEAQRVVEAYLDVIPEYQKGIFLAAMMAANEKSREKKVTGVGQRLAFVLELLGPAEVKLGQVVHSHPQTPADVRADMDRLKKLADPPERWDLWDHYQKTVPPNIRSKIKRLGSVLGAASYYVVVEAEMKDGSHKVLALLRPFAQTRSENGFTLMVDLAKKLGNDDPIARSLIQMIEQAREMAKVETNHELGNKQAHLASQIYDGTEVTAGGRTFRFNTAKNEISGPGYRVMTKADGVHFNDLPEETAEQIAYKRALAKAYVTLELNNILSGREFDLDRHGAQMKIEGEQVTLFDFGGMTLEPPTTAERQQLADAIFDGFNYFKEGKDPSTFVFEEIKRITKKNGEAPRYLMSVQKGLLALGDYLRYVAPQDLPNILYSVIKHGEVHGDIGFRFFNRAVSSGINPTSLIPTNCGEALAEIVRKK